MKHDSNINTTTLVPTRFFFLVTVFLTFFWIGISLGSNPTIVSASEIETSGNDLFDFEAFIKETDITDGTEPFDNNNQAGNDNGSKNGVIRSFDTATYPIKVTINPKKVDKLNDIVLKITGTLENGISDQRVNARFSVGGYENIETGTVGFEQTYTISQTGNSVMIPVSIEVQGAKNGIKLKPNIQVQVVSVDGKDITKDNVITKFNKLPTITTSSRVSIKPYISAGLTGNGIPYYPYQAITGNPEDTENTHAFSVAFGIQKLDGKSDIRGASFPTGKINYRIDLSGYVYWDGGKNKGKSINLNFDDQDSPIYILDEQPIGSGTKRTGSPNTLFEGQEYLYPYVRNYGTANSNMPDLKPSTIEKESYRTVWNSGEWGIDKPTIAKEKVTYNGSNQDYIVGSTFPEYRSDGWTGSKLYGQNDKIFSTNAFLFLMPNEYRIGEANNPDGYANNVYYRATVTIESYVDDNGKEVPINKSGTTTVSERNNPDGSHSVQTTIFSYPNGKQLGTPNIGWGEVSKGDVSTILGEDIQYIAALGSSVVSYGGYDSVFRWNTDSFELTKSYADIGKRNILNLGYYDTALKRISNDTKNQLVYYGIAKFTDNSFESFTSKGKDDYEWYETYEEAIKHGEVGAMLNRVTAPTGPKWTSSARIPLKVKTTNIGSFTDKGTPNIILTNYYAYSDVDRKKEIDVTGNSSYKTPAIWSETGELIEKQTPVGGSINFETLAILNAETSSSISSDKSTYYNSEEVNWTINSSIILPVTGSPDGFDGSVQVQQILPKGLDYKVGSGKQGESPKEPKITKNTDGTTTLTWDLLVSGKNNRIDNVTYTTSINPFALSRGVQSSLTVKNIVSSSVDTRRENLRTSTQTINILKVGMVGIYENIDVDNGEKNSSFTVRMQPYTTIEEEYEVKGLTAIPLSGDDLGSIYQGNAFIEKLEVKGNNKVSIYLNNSLIKSSDPHEIDLTKNGWYKYTGKDQDISKAVSLLFHVEGVLANTDNVEVVMTIKTKDNNFGNMYLNETVINSATDYKLSPVSNKVKYTIRADAELNIERIQIYTANAAKTLPVKLRVNKDVFRERAINEPIKLVLYEKDTGIKVFEKPLTVGTLQRETDLEIPSQFLQTNSNRSYEARIEGYNMDRIYVKEEADKIDTLGYTASEKLIEQQAENNSELYYKGVIMTEREIDKDIEMYYETISLPIQKINSIKSGYGFLLNQKVKYTNDISLRNITPVPMEVLLDSRVVDGDFYEVENGKTKVELVAEENIEGNTVVQTLKYPKVFVQGEDGKILSELQYAELNNNGLTTEIVDGGNKVYVPIWIDELGSYNYLFRNTTPIGINEVNIAVSDTVDVTAYMYGHIGSETIENDEILIVPIDLENPFPDGLPNGWEESDLQWLQGN